MWILGLKGLKRFRITFTANSECQFVPCDQHFPFTCYSLFILSPQKIIIINFMSSSNLIFFGQYLPAIFLMFGARKIELPSCSISLPTNFIYRATLNIIDSPEFLLSFF